MAVRVLHCSSVDGGASVEEVGGKPLSSLPKKESYMTPLLYFPMSNVLYSMENYRKECSCVDCTMLPLHDLIEQIVKQFMYTHVYCM